MPKLENLFKTCLLSLRFAYSFSDSHTCSNGVSTTKIQTA